MITEEYSDVGTNFEAGELVWHYTGFKGLEGILNGNIWASSAAYLNDTLEFRHAIDIALEIMDEENRETPGDFTDAAAAVINFFRGVDGRDAFVVSFSKKGDDLSQWRAYGGKGPSFAIGFDPRRLATKAAESRFDFVRVVYDRATIEDEVRAALRKFRDDFKENPAARNAELHRRISFGADVVGHLMPLAAQCKHESFKDEEEWRLVRRIPVLAREPRFSLRFRESGSLVIPYVEVPIHTPLEKDPTTEPGLPTHVESPLAAINIGPSPHSEALKHAVGEMAARKGVFVNVEQSSTPFRNW